MSAPGVSGSSKICLISEVMYPPYDEGIRICAANVARCLAAHHPILLISERPSQLDGHQVHGLLGNRFFLSARLRRRIAGFAPDKVLYVPWTSLTARTLWRTRMLRAYAPGARVGILALQPRPVSPLMRLLARLGAPGIVLSAGPGSQAQARRLGIPSTRVVPGVDAERFRPGSPRERLELRRRAGVAPESFVIVHVGHVKESRNITVLESIASMQGVRCILIASTSTIAQKELAARLAAAGVLVMTHHQDRIELVYRMADAYLFPVTSVTDAIETPLSVLEAAASGLPIITTRFGGLPDLLGDTTGVIWSATPADMVDAVRRLRAGPPGPVTTRSVVASRTWERTADAILHALGAGGGVS